MFVPVASAAPSWRALDLPPGPGPYGPLAGGRVVTGDGRVHRRVDGVYVTEAFAPGSANTSTWLVDRDDVLWRVVHRPATVIRAGGPPEDVGLSVATAAAADRDGRVWVGSSDGRIVVRGADGWRPLPWVAPLYVDRLVADGAGGVWVGTTGGGAWTRLDEAGAPIEVVPDADGSPGPERGSSVEGDDLWIGGRLEPAPCPVQGLEDDGSGGVVVRCRDGDLLVRDARVDSLPLARREWLHGDLGWVVVADLDQDGLDDLLGQSPTGPRVLLQRGGEFVDGAVDEELRDLVLGAACDVDGDGRQDLVGWRGSGGQAPHQPVLLRRRLGWWDELASDAGATPAPMGIGDSAPPRCVDADGDGDLDIWYPHGTYRHFGGASLALLENLGAGRFRWRGAPREPSVQEWVTDVATGDFDGDGVIDRALVAPWRGLLLVDGASGAPKRLGTGPWGLDPEWGVALATELDGRPPTDLLVATLMHGPRAWRGGAGFAMQDITDEVGLSGLALLRPHVHLVADLTGSGVPDLIACPVGEGPCALAHWRDGSYVVADFWIGAVPTAFTTLDLSGDGDLDLLWVGDGNERLFENRVRDGREVPAPPGWRWGAVARAAAVRRPALHAGTLLPPLGVALVGARRLGPGWRWLAVAVAGVWLAAVDLEPGQRTWLAAGSTVVAMSSVFAGRLIRWWRDAARVDRYRVIEHLGRGGFGTVFVAIDSANGQRVAVKVIHPEHLRDAGDRDRFQAEFDLGRKVRHPHLVRIERFGTGSDADAEGTRSNAWIAMELLDGDSLRLALREGPLPVGDACRVCGQIAAGLAALHASGVVHGDVKPENVMCTSRGAVLTDFGAARGATDRPRGSTTLTRSYSPPEVLNGAPATPAADVYALASTLAEVCDRPSLPAEVEAWLTRARGEEGGRPTAAQSAEVLLRSATPGSRFPRVARAGRSRLGQTWRFLREVLRYLGDAPAPSVEDFASTRRALHPTRTESRGFVPTEPEDR